MKATQVDMYLLSGGSSGAAPPPPPPPLASPPKFLYVNFNALHVAS